LKSFDFTSRKIKRLQGHLKVSDSVTVQTSVKFMLSPTKSLLFS